MFPHLNTIEHILDISDITVIIFKDDRGDRSDVELWSGAPPPAGGAR